ncbi:DUF4124 domain-containing protein [Microbulbifer sp. 2205BS26-8]|uniref:DUF4124 domain-containing protein n=1 Tax=Microbulbifer sp. 2205BS26-8 TaxID=3064386 RepID=UPI00273F4EC5|nr:DUF4124 domain-containing protein [Microbulbifer sp. 2205BS26-8]MDP5210270.1 DUF4124 domain-containing protein [Microbulbifer sp. 2205BS26-8]
MRIALAILFSSLALTAQANGIYKWVDENGVVHFGEQPPNNADVEVIKKPKSERYKQWEAGQQSALAAEEPKALTPKHTTEKKPAGQPERQSVQVEKEIARAEAAARAQRCQASRKTLKTLTSHARVREMDESGNLRMLGEDERQQRIAQEQQSIRKNC